MNKLQLSLALGLLGVAVGCGAKVTVDLPGGAGGNGTGSAGTGGGQAAGTASCDISTGGQHICVTYDFSNDTTGLLASAEASACKASGGTIGPCPTANVIGTCTITAGGATDKETFYSDVNPTLTFAQAQMDCTAAGGSFM